MPEVLFVAGEASGDLHASGVAQELSRRRTGVALTGVGGPRMEAAGVRLISRIDEGVMGFAEVLRHIPRHLMLLRQITERLSSGAVRLLVLIDYPGFNMKVARAAATAGVPVLYYVTPQVWAWGAGRLAELARVVTKAAVILPFEETLLRGHGIDATFVGHPLLDRSTELPSRVDARVALGLHESAPVLALFPGSRQQEIDRHLDDFVASARLAESRVPGLQVLVAAAPAVRIDQSRCPYRVMTAEAFTLLRAANAALCKSGTTTLEAAIADCPLVVAYRTGWLSYEIARFVVTVPYIGLVNVVAGREVAPEFIQNDLRAEALAPQLVRLLDRGSEARAAQLAGLAEVRAKLGTPGAAARVADMAQELMA